MSSDQRSFGEIGTRLLFENDRVRVWEMALAPGEESDLHRHDADYLMIQLEGDRIAARFEPDSEGSFAGRDYIEGTVVPGAVVWADRGGMERAVNVGSRTFREIIVELKE